MSAALFNTVMMKMYVANGNTMFRWPPAKNW